MDKLPKTMRALVAPRQGPPSLYEVRDVPTPTTLSPTQVLLRVHAVGMNTGELQLIQGDLRLFGIVKSVAHTKDTLSRTNMTGPLTQPIASPDIPRCLAMRAQASSSRQA